MDYQTVKNAHIVPRAYLERWAVDRKIGVVQVRDKRLEMAVENIGNAAATSIVVSVRTAPRSMTSSGP